MYCDFCACNMCKTGHDTDGIVLHTQCTDGKWICDVCYHYECCVDAKHDPCTGICGEYKCEHRPKLVNGEWTFWKYQDISSENT
jgi:hypothetical protein